MIPDRFIIVRQGYMVLDLETQEYRKFDSASAAAAACDELNEWWERVQREGARTDEYSLYRHSRKML